MTTLSPSTALFDREWYVATYPEAAEMNPWTHFARPECRNDPNPMFSTAWYLRQHPEVAQSGIGALTDYVRHGAGAGRDPGPLFDTEWYVATYPDTAAAKVDPLEHYLTWGCRERRDPSPVFDSEWYFAEYPFAAEPQTDARRQYMAEGAAMGCNPCALFDTHWYLDHYPDVQASGANPLVHYLTEGARLNYDPGPNFSTAGYLRAHPELLEPWRNPLVHHLAHAPVRGQAHPLRPSAAAIVATRALIERFAAIEPELSDVRDKLERLPVQTFAPTPPTAVWRQLYLSILDHPRWVVMVGSIDDTPGLASVVARLSQCLVIETDTREASIADGLPAGVEWRSLAEYHVDLLFQHGVDILTALVNGVQPEAVLVWGSRRGWQMLAQHGRKLKRFARLYATTAEAPDASSLAIDTHFRSSLPVLETLFGVSEEELAAIVDRFGIPPSLRSKLRLLSDLGQHAAFTPAE